MEIGTGKICDWSGKTQGKHRENTGNLKIQFEWVPCIMLLELLKNQSIKANNVTLLLGWRREWSKERRQVKRIHLYTV